MPGLAPAGDLLFFASPKKPKEKKGDPQSGPLRGSLKKLKEPENLETSLLRSRRTSRFFNPSPSAFSSPARTGWENEFGCGFGIALGLGLHSIAVRERVGEGYPLQIIYMHLTEYSLKGILSNDLGC